MENQELEKAKLELEVKNLEADLKYKQFRTKAMMWGLLFTPISLLIAYFKGGA